MLRALSPAALLAWTLSSASCTPRRLDVVLATVGGGTLCGHVVVRVPRTPANGCSTFAWVLQECIRLDLVPWICAEALRVATTVAAEESTISCSPNTDVSRTVLAWDNTSRVSAGRDYHIDTEYASPSAWGVSLGDYFHVLLAASYQPHANRAHMGSGQQGTVFSGMVCPIEVGERFAGPCVEDARHVDGTCVGIAVQVASWAAGGGFSGEEERLAGAAGVSLSIVWPVSGFAVATPLLDLCIRLQAVRTSRLVLGDLSHGIRVCASVGSAIVRCAHLVPDSAEGRASHACGSFHSARGDEPPFCDGCIDAAILLRDVPVPAGDAGTVLLRAHVYSAAIRSLRVVSTDVLTIVAAHKHVVLPRFAVGGATSTGADASSQLRASDVYIGVMVTAGALMAQATEHMRWVAAARAMGMRVVHFGPECFRDIVRLPDGVRHGNASACEKDTHSAFGAGVPEAPRLYLAGMEVVPCRGCGNSKSGLHCRTMCFWRLAAAAAPAPLWFVRAMDDSMIVPLNLLHHLREIEAGTGGRSDRAPRHATVGGDARYGDSWLDLVYGSPLARGAHGSGSNESVPVPFLLFPEQSLNASVRARHAPRPLVVGDVHYGSGNHLELPAHATAGSRVSGAYWYPGGGCGWAVNSATLALQMAHEAEYNRIIESGWRLRGGYLADDVAAGALYTALGVTAVADGCFSMRAADVQLGVSRCAAIDFGCTRGVSGRRPGYAADASRPTVVEGWKMPDVSAPGGAADAYSALPCRAPLYRPCAFHQVRGPPRREAQRAVVLWSCVARIASPTSGLHRRTRPLAPNAPLCCLGRKPSTPCC